MSEDILSCLAGKPNKGNEANEQNSVSENEKNPVPKNEQNSEKTSANENCKTGGLAPERHPEGKSRISSDADVKETEKVFNKLLNNLRINNKK